MKIICDAFLSLKKHIFNHRNMHFKLFICWCLWMMIMKHLIQSGHALGRIHLSCVCFNQTVKRQKCINSGKMFKRVYKGIYGAHHDTTTARQQGLLPHQFFWLIKLNLKAISDRGNWKKKTKFGTLTLRLRQRKVVNILPQGFNKINSKKIPHQN